MSGELEARRGMVEVQLVQRGIEDPRVLQAMRTVPREAFVLPEARDLAYEDTALLIEEGQTISQPYIVALTAEALSLRGNEHVLEVGTGSGYAAAVLGQLARDVVTVERLANLASSAKGRLERLAADNVRVVLGDGALGWPELAPYDAIAVAASATSVPQALRMQLALGGRLVMPVGERVQVLTRMTRVGDAEWREDRIAEVRFVPLVSDRA
jgi:protein-L-isoaspartate(D-aspartate) O-methyltransferase